MKMLKTGKLLRSWLFQATEDKRKMHAGCMKSSTGHKYDALASGGTRD